MMFKCNPKCSVEITYYLYLQLSFHKTISNRVCLLLLFHHCIRKIGQICKPGSIIQSVYLLLPWEWCKELFFRYEINLYIVLCFSDFIGDMAIMIFQNILVNHSFFTFIYQNEIAFQHCVISVNRFHFYVVDDENEDNQNHYSEETESKRHYDF